MASTYDDSVSRQVSSAVPVSFRSPGPQVGIGFDVEPPAPPDPRLQPSAASGFDWSDGQLKVWPGDHPGSTA